jgi:hypothetical protein
LLHDLFEGVRHDDRRVPVGYRAALPVEHRRSDDGAVIQSWFLTRVFEPFGSVEARLQKVTVKIGGAVKMQVLPNFSVSSDQVDIAQETGSGFLWGSGVWGRTLGGRGHARGVRARLAEGERHRVPVAVR